MESINLWIATVMIAMGGIAIHLIFQGMVLAKPENSKKIGKQMQVAGIVWFVIIVGVFISFLVINWFGATT